MEEEVGDESGKETWDQTRAQKAWWQEVRGPLSGHGESWKATEEGAVPGDLSTAGTEWEEAGEGRSRPKSEASASSSLARRGEIQSE